MAERKTDAETNRDGADHKDGSAYAHSGNDVFTVTVGLAPNMSKSSASKRPYDMHMPTQLTRVPQSEPPSSLQLNIGLVHLCAMQLRLYRQTDHHFYSASGLFTSAHAPSDAVAVVPAN